MSDEEIGVATDTETPDEETPDTTTPDAGGTPAADVAPKPYRVIKDGEREISVRDEAHLDDLVRMGHDYDERNRRMKEEREQLERDFEEYDAQRQRQFDTLQAELASLRQPKVDEVNPLEGDAYMGPFVKDVRKGFAELQKQLAEFRQDAERKEHAAYVRENTRKYETELDKHPIFKSPMYRAWADTQIGKAITSSAQRGRSLPDPAGLAAQIAAEAEEDVKARSNASIADYNARKAKDKASLPPVGPTGTTAQGKQEKPPVGKEDFKEFMEKKHGHLLG